MIQIIFVLCVNIKIFVLCVNIAKKINCGRTAMKYLLMLTFENGENYSIPFEISNNGQIFDLIQNEK